MTSTQIIQKIKAHKIVTIVRLLDWEHTQSVVEAIYAGGIKTIEITVTTPKAMETISYFAKHGPSDLLLGAGSVVNTAMLHNCIQAGAQYIVTPAICEEVISEAAKSDVPVLAGALTPTEILRAYNLGCSLIKVFPAEFFGLNYIKALKAPMPQVDLVPTGGVNVDNILGWFKAGASAVGVGNAILQGFDPKLKNYQVITENAVAFSKQLSAV